MNPDFINPLVLAYLGDSVLELLVRDYLVKESELKKVNELCQEATHFVSSLSHEKFILHYDYSIESAQKSIAKG